MNLNAVSQALQAEGWKDVMAGPYEGIPFELLARRRYPTGTHWSFMIKHIPTLDDTTVGQVYQEFEYINGKSKSFVWGRGFIMVIATWQPHPAYVQQLVRHTMGALGGFIRMKGGGGLGMVVDDAARVVHASVPAVPIDAAQYGNQIKNILQQAVHAPQ